MNTTFPNGFDPTHEGTIYGIPIWWDERTSSLMGKNKFYDWLSLYIGYFHGFFSTVTGFFIPSWDDPGFPLKLKPLPGFENMPVDDDRPDNDDNGAA